MYRNRILIQKNDLTADTQTFDDADKWEDFYSCRCDIVTNMGAAMWEMQAEGYERTVTVYLRYCKKAAEIVPVKYRFLYKEQIYNILSGYVVNEKNMRLRIKGGLKL